MASPQKENGHLDIANELAEIFAKLYLSPTEWQILWVVLRKTWAWGKKDDWISLSQFERYTGLSRVSVCRAIKKLVTKRILVKTNKKLMFAKNYDNWLVTDTTLVTKRLIGSVVSVLPASVADDTHKRNYTKETIQKKDTSEIRGQLRKKLEEQKILPIRR